ncbi:aldehyde dehydrogenase family protein [Deinococcus metallilatus]|uniref:Succinate-semialdehyde dehydrogenase/glutarate-semialdehyde dehydrogenase n=2 Tax=Deinococcus metallilatus TaxID=1211322 RepID=A0ABR6MPW7_9DEIO|nr:aldehyde dehydrogenase family protein [Deinococcus metallilatus]MBB5293365.1 succinate-semialdehyde dehydrogenase/glutarate-semialdehyde dehydrogenase [Deinococcus metallilatus]GMA15412.1 aldehyde dehydrogenase [Deinococcus metallilatus]
MTQTASVETTPMIIGGQPTLSSTGRTYEVRNPANGQVVGAVPQATVEDANRAVEAAQAAFRGWAETSPDDRAELLFKGIALLKANEKEIVRLLSQEQGKPVFEAKGEVHHLIHGLTFYAGLSSKIRGAEVPLPPAMGKYSYGVLFRRPVGVAVGITPWNFPLTLMGTKVGPALIAGCPIIIKPAQTTPLATLRVVELLNEAGLPPGVLQCVTGSGSELGEPLITHPAVRRVALTGSSNTGRRVMELAGRDFKRVTLELGGSDPMIVCPDANLKAAINGAMVGRFWNAGQQCLAVKRLYVFEEVYEEFLSGLIDKVSRYELGDPSTPAEKPKVRMGPMHAEFQRREIEEQLADAVAKGAKVVLGGKRPEGLDQGFYFQPTIVTDVPEDSRLVTEEVFGPVLPVFRVKTLDEAIQKANNSPWGLGSSIWTNNMIWANKAVREIEAGVTWINMIHYGYDELPFGGVKASGLGREHGPEAVDYYLEDKGAVFGGLEG